MKVMTPKPRKAKKVSATLDTMSRSGGYPDTASRSQSTLASVVTAKMPRIPTTTTTTTVCARATAWEPRTLSAVMTTTSSTANVFVHAAPPSAKAALA